MHRDVKHRQGLFPTNPFAFPPSLEVRCARAALAANIPERKTCTPNSRPRSLLQDLIEAAERRSGHWPRTFQSVRAGADEAQGCRESGLGREPSGAQDLTPNSRPRSRRTRSYGREHSRRVRPYGRIAQGKPAATRYCYRSTADVRRSGLGREHSGAQDCTPNSRPRSLLQDPIEAAERRSGHCTGTCRCREAQGCYRERPWPRTFRSARLYAEFATKVANLQDLIEAAAPYSRASPLLQDAFYRSRGA